MKRVDTTAVEESSTEAIPAATEATAATEANAARNAPIEATVPTALEYTVPTEYTGAIATVTRVSTLP